MKMKAITAIAPVTDDTAIIVVYSAWKCY